jgi:hypothetical protein
MPDGSLVTPRAIIAVSTRINSKDRSVLTDPITIPAMLIPRSFCFLRNERTPVIIAGTPVKIKNPVSESIPNTREVIAKPFPVSLRSGLAVTSFGLVVCLVGVIVIILADAHLAFYELSHFGFEMSRLHGPFQVTDNLILAIMRCHDDYFGHPLLYPLGTVQLHPFYQLHSRAKDHS